MKNLHFLNKRKKKKLGHYILELRGGKKIMKTFEGNLVGTGLKVGIVVGRFNAFINEKLLEGALDGLKRHGVSEENIDVAWVPGAFEIPLALKKWLKQTNMMRLLL